MKDIFSFNFKNKKAIVRTDFNVPLNNGKIEDATKIMVSLPTVNKILADGGRVVLISHFGRPDGLEKKEFSLEIVYNFLKSIYTKEIAFARIEDDPEKYNEKIILLENLRFYPEEETNDPIFAKKISAWGDVYVNDAFATIHRKHASLVSLANLFEEKLLGLSLQNEFNIINQLTNTPKKPLTIIVGGGKVEDKILPLKNLAEKADNILLGGVVANTFLKAKSKNIGLSTYDEDNIALALEIIKICEKNNINLLLPIDCVILESDSDSENKEFFPFVCDIDSIQNNQAIMDIGPETVELYTDVIEDSHSLFWSGPMGMIEHEVFRKGTQEIISATINLVKRGGNSLIGGGETGILARQSQKNVGHISTGGSALLKYLEGKKLPAVWW